MAEKSLKIKDFKNDNSYPTPPNVG